MSNPGVVTLANKQINGKFKIVVEDNIGESIHLHLNNSRIDLNVQEFFSLCEVLKNSLNNLDVFCGFDIENFDEHFLVESSNLICDLINIEIEEIKISNLKFIKYNESKNGIKFKKIVSIAGSPSFKYLKGEIAEFLEYSQYNYFNNNNEFRLKKTLESISQFGYPLKNKYIILFGKQNIVRDGQHRAAILAHLFGINSSIKVMRFKFKNDRYYIHVNWSNFKEIIKLCFRRLLIIMRRSGNFFKKYF